MVSLVLSAYPTIMSAGVHDTLSAGSEDGSDVDILDSPISSSQSAYTHAFTSPAPEQHESQPHLQELPVPADQREITHIKVLQLPIEVVDYIAFFLFNSCPSECFFHIHSFSLVCSQFRYIALRHYFSSIRIVSARQLASYTDLHVSLASRNTSHDSVGLYCVKCVYFIYLHRALMRSLSGMIPEHS
jgi:hypothetical protein